MKNKGFFTKKVAIIILFIGIIIGSYLCIYGYNISNNDKNIEEDNEEVIQNNRDIIDEKIATLEDEIDTLNDELSDIFLSDHGFSNRYNIKRDEISIKRNELSELRRELYDYKSQFNTEYDNIGLSEIIDSYTIDTNISFYLYGSYVILVSIIFSLIIYMTARRREKLINKINNI